MVYLILSGSAKQRAEQSRVILNLQTTFKVEVNILAASVQKMLNKFKSVHPDKMLLSTKITKKKKICKALHDNRIRI